LACSLPEVSQLHNVSPYSSEISIFLDITPCNILKVNRRFERYSLGVQDLKDKPSKKISCHVCYLLDASFLLGLFLDPEIAGDMFIRNVD
jgi:hypothetical protein